MRARRTVLENRTRGRMVGNGWEIGVAFENGSIKVVDGNEETRIVVRASSGVFSSVHCDDSATES